MGTICRSDFLRLALEAAGLNPMPGFRFDPEAAWDAYDAGLTRWVERCADNPEGDHVAVLVLSDGPWWVAT